MFQGLFFIEFVASVEQFLKSLSLSRKANLIIENVPSHPDEDELSSGDITVLFLRPNITSLCQPMDQGVLEALKKKYSHELLTMFTKVTDDGNGMLNKLQNVTLKDVIYWITQSWEETEPQTLPRLQKKLFSEEKIYNGARKL